MKALLRSLLLVLAGLCAALAVTRADDGGGGDSGVWILPRSSYIGTSGTNIVSTTTPRAAYQHQNLARDLAMKISREMTAPTGVLTDPVGNQSMLLPVNGPMVTIPGPMFQALANAGVTVTYGTIVDGQGCGYVLRLRFDLAQRTATVEVF